MIKKISLSVFLPVYNAETTLRTTLNSVVKQLNSKNSDLVKIIISDNCSTDGTEAICRKFLNKYPDNIIYSRNTENIGALKNIGKVADLCESDYFWFCGDDAFHDNAISYILKFLKDNPHLGTIVTRTDIYAGDDIELTNSIETSPLTNKGVDIICDNVGDFLIHSLDKIYFLSDTIFKRSSWQKYFYDIAIAYPHTKVMLTIANHEPSAVIDKILIKQRSSAWWNAEKFDFCLQVAWDTFNLYKSVTPNEMIKYYPQFFYSVQIMNSFFKKRTWNALSAERKKQITDLYFTEDFFLYSFEKYFTKLLFLLNFNLGAKFLKILMKAEGRYGMRQKTKNPLHYLFFFYWSTLDKFQLTFLKKQTRYFHRLSSNLGESIIIKQKR